MRLGNGWVPALRVARREALRARGRSILVVAMIALPVLGVTAADVVLQTSEITGAEAVERSLGLADARIEVRPGGRPMAQAADPYGAGQVTVGRRQGPRTLADVSAALDQEVEAVELATGQVYVETDAGLALTQVTEVDLGDDLTAGLFRLAEGRVPTRSDEVVVNSDLAERGTGVGRELVVRDGPTLTVVGIGESASYRGYPIAVGTLGSFDLPTREGQHVWLVDAGGPVTWADVRALNEIGAIVLSRAVLADPPGTSQLAPQMRGREDLTDDELAMGALVVAMALLEVVLLAGPAFAVIARRQQRSLALMAATGATPAQARRVVLASGVVLGLAGAVVGVALGLTAAWLSLPVVQRFSASVLGPYDAPWSHLGAIAGLGLLSALLAAVVPAWVASRQDVVAVLAGRRGDRRPSTRSPLLGAILVGLGVAGATAGVSQHTMGPYTIAVSAVVSVLGMILLVPVALVGLARIARGLPLALRFAVRDAARHRTRTVPAVAAVAAAVTGVVALGIALSSDAAQSEATYTPLLPAGQAVVSAYADQDWDAYRRVIESSLPAAEVTSMPGILDEEAGRTSREVRFRVAGAGRRGVLSTWTGGFGGMPVSTDGRVPAHVLGLTGAERAAGEEVLRNGGVVVFTDQDDLSAEEATVVVRENHRRTSEVIGRATVPALLVTVSGVDTVGQGVLSAGATASLGIEPQTVGLLVEGAAISEQQEQDVAEGLAALNLDGELYVERGYGDDSQAVLVQLVLAALGAVLMLGGTLTATYLSLSDARPDLATLASIGASPRTRRGVAAAYAAVIGLVGAVLGAVVGFIPGIAVTYPMTGGSWVQEIDPTLPSHFLDVPWLLIGGLVVALPLLTAAAVGLTTRSRLPMVARID